MSSQTLSAPQTLSATKPCTLLAAVWVALALGAWAIELRPDDIGLVVVAVLFFQFVPMVACLGALFGRPVFGAAVGIAMVVVLMGLETANAIGIL